VNVNNPRLEKAINQFNDSRLLILNFCDQELHEEEKQDQFLQDIHEVFANEANSTPTPGKLEKKGKLEELHTETSN
jgi:hypothetical protein